MDNTTLITQAHVAAHQHVIRDRLPEDLDAQHVRNDLLRLALDVRVHERDVVVGANHITESGKPLLDALDAHLVGDAVAQVLQLLVGGRGGDEQALAVAGRQAADDARAGDGRVADGDDVLQLGFEDGVEVLRGADGDEGVRVGEGREDADSVEEGKKSSLADYIRIFLCGLTVVGGQRGELKAAKRVKSRRRVFLAPRIPATEKGLIAQARALLKMNVSSHIAGCGTAIHHPLPALHACTRPRHGGAAGQRKKR